MGLIEKFKNMFTEEVEEDEDIVAPAKPIEQKSFSAEKNEEPKRRYYAERTENLENLKKEIPTRKSPVLDNEEIIKSYTTEEPVIKNEQKNEVKEDYREIVQEKQPMKREEKFVFPVYFDDKDFEKIEEKKPKIEQPKKEPIVEKKEAVLPKKEIYGTKIEKKEEKKVFQPTPIISPIYGILNKNYQKEDICSKKVSRTEFRDPNKPLTIDEVRKKAYGNINEDLENSLIAKSSIFMEPDNNIEEQEETKNNLLTDLVDENSNELENEYNSIDEFLNSPIEEYSEKHKNVKDEDIDDTLNDLEKEITKKTSKNSRVKKNKNKALDELLEDSDDKLLEDYIMNNNLNSDNNNFDVNDEDEDLTQSDLFNLIDSMYEKGED